MRHTLGALHRPVTTLMVFAAIAVVGLVGARLLPLEQFPDVTFPFMGVTIPYPGSTPEEIEEVITRPVEEALSTLPGIKQVRSQSKSDAAELQIEFEWGTDVDAATFGVRSRLDSIRQQLPRAANRILMFTASSANQPVLTVRLSADQDLSTQYDVLDRVLRKPIERIDGVARVELAGVEPREVRVLLDANRCAAHGVEVRQLVELLERSNFSVSAGQVTSQGRRLSVRPIGELGSIAALSDLVITGNVRLRDVATVELVSPELTVRRNLDGRPAVGLDVYKSTQANIVQVADAVLQVIERAQSLPQMQGVRLIVMDNQAASIRSSLADVSEAGIFGALLAVLVLFAFLRHWPTTLFVSLAVPISLLATLAVMYFIDMSINVLSLMGMMLAIGMLVDNAVVVTESVFRHRQLDPGNALAATYRGVREVGVATLAGTATAVVVFLPVIFGQRNQATIFLSHVAVPIVVAMVASLLVAQTLIPMLTSRFPAPPPAPAGGWIAVLEERYVRALAWMLARRRRPALILGGALLLTVGLAALSAVYPDRFLKVDMFPQEAGRQLVIDYHIEGEHPIERVAQSVATVESRLTPLRAELGIERIYSRFDAQQAVTLIALAADRDGLPAPAVVMERIAARLPPVLIGKPSFSFEQLGSNGNLSLQVSGESTARLAAVAADLVRVLGGVEGLEGVRSDARDGDDEVQIIVDRTRAATLGVSPSSVATSVAAALRGDRLRELRGPDRELTLRLAFRSSDRQNIDDLAALPVYLPGGERITLGSVASFRTTRGARSIQRVDRLTSVVITGGVSNRTTLQQARERVERVMASYRLPPGYGWKFGNGVDDNDETLTMMQFNLLIALVMIYLVMAALFESTVLPASVIGSIFLAIMGVVWTLYLTHTTLTFMALIGVQILMGVVVNIGIVLVAHVNDLRGAGLPRLEAVLEAARHRLRPILMTTLTTALGLLPLAIGDSHLAVGTVGPSYAPMALAIMGGLAVGAVTSMFAVPAAYLALDDAMAALRRFATASRVEPPRGEISAAGS
jgi:hydrophobic/amphiphilic exporter-1 (mainly G- bacteria), HAE1 family